VGLLNFLRGVGIAEVDLFLRDKVVVFEYWHFGGVYLGGEACAVELWQLNPICLMLARAGMVNGYHLVAQPLY